MWAQRESDIVMNGFWIFMVLCVICATVTRIVTAKLRYRESNRYNDDDTRITQEIHGGLIRMDERIEALETILMERTESPSVYHD